MQKEYILSFEEVCSRRSNLIGFSLGKEIRKYFEDLGVDFKKIEEKRLVVCYIPDNIVCIDENFINGFLGDRIKENGVDIFLKYDVYCNNSYVVRVIYESVKKLIE